MINNNLIISKLKNALPQIIAVYAFGSRIKETAQANSDLDLAVLTTTYVEPLVLWQLANELADDLSIEIDLLDLRAASTVMQYQVITTGRLLSGESLAVGLFECFVLSEKTELDTARAKLLDDIIKTGSVYDR